MPQHLRALVFILVLATFVFALAKTVTHDLGIDDDEFRRRRNLWFAVTLIAFLAHNFWIYILLTGFLVARFAARDSNPLALYALLLFAVPSFDKPIPGIGPIDHIFYIGHVRLLNLVILLPYALRLRRARDPSQSMYRAPDIFLGAWAIWLTLVHAGSDTVPGAVRAAFYMFVDVVLPYYVASRALTSAKKTGETLSYFFLACLILGLIATFETARHWLVYESLRDPLDIPREAWVYLTRGAGGLLRARASVLHAIALGYVLVVGLVLFACLASRIKVRWKRYAAGGLLVTGLIASMSRGPWVGAAIALLSLTMLAPGAGRRFAQLVGGGTVALVVLLVSPFGDTVINYLPFVGNVESNNIDYREKLFSVSMIVMQQNFWTGDLFFEANPLMEQMRQGQGIIDIVNSYLQIALPYGFLGLLFFTSTLVSATLAANKSRRLAKGKDAEGELYGRALVGAMIGIFVTIATVSSISLIPTVYWMMAGLCVGYARIFSPAARREAAVARRVGATHDNARA